MESRSAIDIQLAAYRRMTGEERLALALGLHEMACDLAREGIRNQHPGADEDEVERRLRERIALSYTVHEPRRRSSPA